MGPGLLKLKMPRCSGLDNDSLAWLLGTCPRLETLDLRYSWGLASDKILIAASEACRCVTPA